MTRYFMSFSLDLQEELEALKAKLEKVEKEKNELKVSNERLESRVSTENICQMSVVRNYAAKLLLRAIYPSWLML